MTTGAFSAGSTTRFSPSPVTPRARSTAAAQDGPTDPPSVLAAGPTPPPEGDGLPPGPPDVLRAVQAVIAEIAEHRWHGVAPDDEDDYAACCLCGWQGPARWREHVVVADYAGHVAELVVAALTPLIAAAALRDYAGRHHAHPGGPLDLVREAYSLYGERYLACRACGTRLDEAGACTGERPRLLRAADRIARGGPDPADPPRPGTEYVPETIVREVDRG